MHRALHKNKNTLSARALALGVLAMLVVLVTLFNYPPTERASATSCPYFGSVVGTQCRGYLTTASVSFTVPNDWNNTSNTIEVIGGGGNGAGGYNGKSGGGGGGGGYSKVTNLSLTAGNTITFQVGAGGNNVSSGHSGEFGDAGTASFFNGSSCGTSSVCANGGTGGNPSGLSSGDGTPGNGGTAAVGVGSTGGAGGAGGLVANNSGGGGGGAAGLFGVGGAGTAGNSSNGGNGGTGDNTHGGPGANGSTCGSNAACTGGAGVEWDATHGSGGGGASSSSARNGTGGNYGGGGTGNTNAHGTAGANGLIVITYTPQNAVAPTVTTSAASGITASSATLNGNITATGGANPTTRGFAYGTSATLTSGVSTTSEAGSFGTGAFTYAAGSLSGGTTYYVRAYATTNAVGTGYGTTLSFMTASQCPVNCPGSFAPNCVANSGYSYNPVGNLCSALPTVSVTATDNIATAYPHSPADTGTYTFTCTAGAGSCANLPIAYSISGATYNTDYTLAGGSCGSVTPSGATMSVNPCTVVLTAVDSFSPQSDKTATLTLTSNSSFAATAPVSDSINVYSGRYNIQNGSATMTITGYTVQAGCIGAACPGGGVNLVMSPSHVRKGVPTLVLFSYSVQNMTGCNINGTAVGNTYGSNFAKLLVQITQSTLYTLTCTDGVQTQSVSQILGVVPTFLEI